MTDVDFQQAKEAMIQHQVAARDVREPRVLEAMRKVPREAFVPAFLQAAAYDDRPQQIGYDQTISQPYVVALMTEALQLRGGEKVLEVGTGSGYQTAILAEMGARVFTVERIAKLSLRAQQVLRQLGYARIQFRVDDGAAGWPEEAPFDAIIVTAGAATLPATYQVQLVEGGRLVIPVGPLGNQVLHRYVLRGGQLEDEILSRVSFVPLISEPPVA